MNNRIKMTDSKFKCNIFLFLSVTVFMARLSIYTVSAHSKLILGAIIGPIYRSSISLLILLRLFVECVHCTMASTTFYFSAIKISRLSSDVDANTYSLITKRALKLVLV
jgi:hypothetical protein